MVGKTGQSAIAGDGRSTLELHTRAWPAELVPGALAQTVLVVDGAGHITDADVHVNGKDHRFTIDGAEADGTVDLRSVLVHELGHLFGLGHSADLAATMLATIAGTRARTPERDDELGACALYPGEIAKRAPRCPEAPCPVGFTCLAGSCERRGTPKSTCAPCARPRATAARPRAR